MAGLLYFPKHTLLIVNLHVHFHDGEQKEAQFMFQSPHSKTPKSLFPSARVIHLQWYWLLLPSHRMKSSRPRAAVSEWVPAEKYGRKPTFQKFNIDKGVSFSKTIVFGIYVKFSGCKVSPAVTQRFTSRLKKSRLKGRDHPMMFVGLKV